MDQPQHTPPPTTGMIDRLNLYIHIEKYREMFARRWWIIATCLAIAWIFSGYRAWTQPDIYLATGSMMVSPKLNLKIGDTPGEELGNFYQTQADLMKSRRVVGQAQAKLSEQEKDIEKKISQPVLVDGPFPFQKHNSNIFSISAKSNSREYAILFVDQIMKEFIAYKKSMTDELSLSAASALHSEIDQLEKDRKKAEDALYEFQKQNNMAYFEGQGNLAAQYLIDKKRQLAEIGTEIGLLDNEAGYGMNLPLNTPSKGTETTENSSTNNSSQPFISSKNLKIQNDNLNIKNAIALLKAERESLIKDLKPKHPKIVRMDEEIQRKELLLKVASQQTKEQIVAYRESLIKQREVLEVDIANWEKEALKASQKSGEFARLNSDLTRIRELYNILLKQYQEIDIGKNTKQEVISINETAVAASQPVEPNRIKNMLIATLLALVISISLILLLDRFDDRIRNVEELQDLVGETVLGQIPSAATGKQSSPVPILMTNLPAHNAFAESFRNVRSSLMFYPGGGEARTIAVTSAIPGDGKTTCTVNLAISLAQLEGSRTLIIDADMRRMNVHKYFQLDNDTGLADVLSGEADLSSSIVHTGISNLDLLRAGSPPHNPGELILSDNFKTLINDLKKTYQRIIIDTPPVMATDDTLSLTPNVDGVIFVVKAKHTSFRFVDRSLVLLKQRGAKPFGIILNHIDTTSAHYYYYYYHVGDYYAQTPQAKKSSRKHG